MSGREYVGVEPHGWPYDGARETLRRAFTGSLELEREFRHIDADAPKITRQYLTPVEAAAWLREQGADFARVEEFLPGVCDDAETLVTEGDGDQPDGTAQVRVRRLAPGVYFHETLWLTTARPVDGDEALARAILPLVGSVVGWVRDRLYEAEGEHPARSERIRRWLTREQVREALAEAGVEPARIDELCPAE